MSRITEASRANTIPEYLGWAQVQIPLSIHKNITRTWVWVTPAWVWTGRKYPASLHLSPSGIWVGIHRLLQSVWTGRAGAAALPQIPSSWMQTPPLLQTPQGGNLITLIRHFFPPCLDYICFWSGQGDSECCQMLSHGMFGSRLNCGFPAFMNLQVFLVSVISEIFQSQAKSSIANQAFAGTQGWQ